MLYSITMKKKTYEMKVEMIENHEHGQAIVDVHLPTNNPDTYYHLQQHFTSDYIYIDLWEHPRYECAASIFPLKTEKICLKKREDNSTYP